MELSFEATLAKGKNVVRSFMFNWNLRQMFYWTSVIALIIPYLIALIPKPVEPAVC